MGCEEGEASDDCNFATVYQINVDDGYVVSENLVCDDFNEDDIQIQVTCDDYYNLSTFNCTQDSQIICLDNFLNFTFNRTGCSNNNCDNIIECNHECNESICYEGQCHEELPCFGSLPEGTVNGTGIFNYTHVPHSMNWTHTFNHTPGVCEYTCDLYGSYRWNGTECVYDPKLNCYHETDENKCNVILNENNLIEYLGSNKCTEPFEDELLACCTHKGCGNNDLYKYVPIKNVLKIHNELDNCDECGVVLNESNHIEFFADDNCYDRKRNMVCCTSVLCSDEEYKTFVPIWAII